MKRIILFIVVSLLLTSCHMIETKSEDLFDESDKEMTLVKVDPTIEDDHGPQVTITMQDNQIIRIQLLPEIAPNTVNNFISLIDSNYYDGLIFHRVIKDFMIQGGDPDGTGLGGPGYTINDEFYFQEQKTKTYLPHYRGVLSMAKTTSPNSAGSQFFIMHQDKHQLDGNYSSFGYVIEGMDVVDLIAETETDRHSKPLEDVIIQSIRVELNGYEFKEPIVNKD